MEKLQAVVAALHQRAELLTGKRVAAQKALDDAIGLRQETLISGDLDDGARLLKMQNAVDSAASTLAGLDGAISALRIQIADAEAQLNAEAERARRQLASEEIAKNVAEVERLIGPWLTASQEIAVAFGKLASIYEAAQIGRFIANTASETEVAVAVTLVELRNLPKAVAEGRAPIPHRPEPVAPVTVIPPAPCVQLFCMRPIKWRDAQGQQRIAQKFSDANLTPSAASRGLACGALVPLDSQLRRQHHNTVEGHARADLAFDLDADPVGPSTEPIQHSAFEPPIVGKPYTLRVAR